MTDTTHPCPKVGCPRRVEFRSLACSRHWFELPPELRRAVASAWRSGDLEAHRIARADAVAYLNPA